MKRLSFVKVIAALCICNAYIFSCAVTGTVKSEPANETSEDDGSGDEKLGYGGTVDFFGEDDIYKTEDNTSAPTVITSTVSIKGLGFAKPDISARKPASAAYNPSESVKELAQSSIASVDTNVDPNDQTIIVDVKPAVSSSTTGTTHEPIASTPETSSSSSTTQETSSSSEVSSDVSSSASTSTSTSTSTSSSAVSSSAASSDSDIPQGVIDHNASSAASSSSSTVSSPTSRPNTTPNYDPESEIFRVNNGGTVVSGSAVDIVSRIVENEVGHTFAPEAIKAQAVTAYTFVKYSNLRGNSPYCILKSTASDSVKTLVQSVIGEGIYYNGELIQAVYSASSAGCTASSQNVWGGYIPYLQSVYCELDELYDPNYGKTVTFSEEEMRIRMLNYANIRLSGDPSEWFEIQTRVENQGGKYVGNMKIGGNEYFTDNDGDTLRITGRRFREIIMDYDIRSSAFDITYDANTGMFTITTYGYGHGVGLSQNGANNLAKYWGWDYKKILTFYFQGTEVY